MDADVCHVDFVICAMYKNSMDYQPVYLDTRRGGSVAMVLGY